MHTSQTKNNPTWAITGTLNLIANGRPLELTTYSDGDVVLWAPDANISIEISHKEVEKLRTTLNGMKSPYEIKQLKAMIAPATVKLTAPVAVPVIKHLLADERTPLTDRKVINRKEAKKLVTEQLVAAQLAEELPVESATVSVTVQTLIPNTVPVEVRSGATVKKLERSVHKDDKGWGSNVKIGSNTVRYYYKTRDLARASMSNHRAGDASGRVS